VQPKMNGWRTRRVGIIGAGDAGAVLAHELSLKPGYGLSPVAFFDDDKRKWHSRVHEIPVLGTPERLTDASAKLDIQEAIIAMPSAPAKRIGEIVRLLRQARLPCKTIPSLDQLALGQVRVSQLRNIEVQDLLGRERVELETENIRLTLQDRVVLVSGAGGSIGSELCRQIATYHPASLLLLDRSEPNVFQIEQELIGLGHGQAIVPLVADILDAGRMREVLSRYRPHVIFHAGAHKHVPMTEASMLVLQSAAQGIGGEIFVLDMGKPVKIVDLARQMIELSGLKPDQDIEIEFIGMRPGEKLFEEISHHGENFVPTAHRGIL